MTKEEILAFIKTKKYTVLSTSGENGFPEAALMAFAETDAFELIFGTSRTSRKYANLKKNNKVALVIGWDADAVTVQYEGLASELAGADIEQYVPAYHTKVPGAVVYKYHPDQTYWKIKPTWVRYSDLSGDERKVYEFSF